MGSCIVDVQEPQETSRTDHHTKRVTLCQGKYLHTRGSKYFRHIEIQRDFVRVCAERNE